MKTQLTERPRTRGERIHWKWTDLAALSVALVWTVPAEARSRGLAGTGCNGCHGNQVDSSLSLSPLVVTPGADATLSFTLQDPNAAVAGIFIQLEDADGFSVPDGSQLAFVPAGISHTSPKNFSAGAAVYQVNWSVPGGAGAVRFFVTALAANGDGRSGGDEASSEVFDVVYGCAPQTFYSDSDGDGYGRETGVLTQCAGAAPDGYASEAGDCDDFIETRYPGAEEYCNRKDDDCDGLIDEDALPVLLFPDADGDGYYSHEESMSTDTKVGCVPYPGYADSLGDCDGENPLSHPGAEEVCDLYTDENCDGRVDERARPICGVGWCRRESYTCDLDDCTPGDPVPETCNFMDDDCDDEVDEGALCPSGEECLAGECRPAELSTDDAEVPTSPEGSSGGRSSSMSEGSPARKSSPPGGCATGISGANSNNFLVFFFTVAALFVRRRKATLL